MKYLMPNLIMLCRNIRFVGIYDTVPHHGLLQGNDIEDLGLNSVRKANYTVHLVADNEYRKNFSLVDISCITGKIGGGSTSKGIELYLPGVHCDVGGSYVEGRDETIGRIMANKYFKEPLEKEKRELVAQGWFKYNDLTIRYENLIRGMLLGQSHVLSSYRKQISNQYSYIPLHIMVNFCKDKGLSIDPDIYKKFKFITTAYSDAVFLDVIKKRLQEYANGGKKFVYEPLPFEPNINKEENNEPPQIAQDNTKVVIPKKDANITLNELKEQHHNQDIRRLRYEYLHWNSAYGEGIKYTLLQPYEPNLDNEGKRKREVRG